MPIFGLAERCPGMSPAEGHNVGNCIMDCPWSLRELAGSSRYDSGVSWSEGLCLAAKGLPGGGETRPPSQELPPKVRMPSLPGRSQQPLCIPQWERERTMPGRDGCPGTGRLELVPSRNWMTLVCLGMEEAELCSEIWGAGWGRPGPWEG